MFSAARNQKGFMLVDVLLSLGLAVGLFLAVSHVLHSQVAIIQRLKTKMELTSLHLDLQRAFAVPATCIRNFAAPFTIDEYQLGTANYGVALPSLVEDGSPVETLIATGQRINGLTYEESVIGIRAVNMVKTATDRFLVDIVAPVRGRDGVTLQILSLTRIELQTDPASPNSAKRPIACRYGASAAGSSLSLSNCRLSTSTGTDVRPKTELCAADEFIVTGGGSCVTYTGAEWDEPAPPPPAEVGYVHMSRPVQVGTDSGWEFDCYNPSLAGDLAQSKTVAYCCKR